MRHRKSLPKVGSFVLWIINLKGSLRRDENKLDITSPVAARAADVFHVVRFQAAWIKQAPLPGWQRWLASLLHALLHAWEGKPPNSKSANS